MITSMDNSTLCTLFLEAIIMDMTHWTVNKREHWALTPENKRMILDILCFLGLFFC